MVDVNFIKKHWSEIVKYAEGEEKIILNSGRTLTSEEKDIAKYMGVKYPEKVRILEVDEILKPEEPVLHEICEDSMLIDNPNGLTFGYGFYLKRKHLNSTIPHELVHVSQYEEFGIEGFLNLYKEQYIEYVLKEKLKKRDIPLEQEAYSKSKKII